MEHYSTMSPNGDLSFDIFGSANEVEAVELWYRKSVSGSTIVPVVETLIGSLVPAHRTEGLRWFEGAMNQAGKHQTHLGGMYLTFYCCDDILQRAFFSIDIEKQ